MTRKNSLRDRAKKRVGRALSRPDRYPNLHWSVNWSVAGRPCLLNCDYCRPDREVQEPDVWAAAEELIRLGAFEIIITGGEPMAIPEMGDVIRLLHERLEGPRIALNTNLVLPFEKVEPLLPYVDVLMTSIDGLDGNNKVHRHVDGEKILDQVRRVVEWRQKSGVEKPSITVNATLTPHNYRTVPTLARRLDEIDPEIHYSIATVEPYWDKLSLFEHPEELRGCALMVRRAVENGAAIHAYGPLEEVIGDPEGFFRKRSEERPPKTAQPGRTIDDSMCVECVRQFFWGIMTPRGEFQACKAGFHNRLLGSAAWSALRAGRPLRGARLLGRLVDHLYLRKTNPHCYLPCKCDIFVEHILRSCEGAPPHDAVRLWHGRVPEDKLEEGVCFLRRHFSIDLSREVQDAIRKSSSSEDGPPGSPVHSE
jgi:pyruvate-formate lyase-activating enzyme